MARSNRRLPSGSSWPAQPTRRAGACGEASQSTSRAGRGAYQLFVLAAGGAAALVDPDVFRAVVRRNGFLDRTDPLDDNVALQEHSETIFCDLQARPRTAPGVARDELLRVVSAAVA